MKLKVLSCFPVQSDYQRSLPLVENLFKGSFTTWHCYKPLEQEVWFCWTQLPQLDVIHSCSAHKSIIISKTNVRVGVFKVICAVNVKINPIMNVDVFWDITRCNMIEIYGRSESLAKCTASRPRTTALTSFRGNNSWQITRNSLMDKLPNARSR
jgi:hypothetical protein